MRRGTVWLIGALGIVVLWGAAVAYKARPIERSVAVAAVGELKRRGLDRRFEALSIQIDGRDLTLIGTALSEEDRAAALAAAAGAPGVGRVADQIKVAPLAKPFVFRAVRNADGSVTLDGVAPGPELLDRVVELGRSLFGRHLHLSLRVARGAPEGDWFAAVKVALESVSMIERGEAVLSDRRLTLTGRAANDGAMEAVKTTLARAMPAGYTGASELATPLDEELRAGPLTAVKDCQALFDKVAVGHMVRFAPGGDALADTPPRMLDRMALAARRCGSLYLLIYAASDTHAGDAAVNLRLSEARARTLAAELAKRGVPRERITALGRGGIDPRIRAGRSDVEFRASDSAVPVVRPYVWQFEKMQDGNGVISGHHPSREAESTLAGAARPALRGTLSEASRLAHGAPPGDWLTAARLAIEAIARLEYGIAALTDYELLLRGVARDDDTARAIEAALDERMPRAFRAKIAISTVLDEALAGGEIADAARCQALIDSVAQTAAVELVFDGPALLGHQRRLFERLAAAVRRCKGFALEIGAHSSGNGDPEAARALSERWAQAVAEAIAGAGGERQRLRAIGFGNTRPLADGATDAGRLRNRRIAFRIVP